MVLLCHPQSFGSGSGVFVWIRILIRFKFHPPNPGAKKGAEKALKVIYKKKT